MNQTPSGLNGLLRRWASLGPKRNPFLSDCGDLGLELASMRTGTLSMIKTFLRPRTRLENRPSPWRRSVSVLWKNFRLLWRFGYRQRQDINHILQRYAEPIGPLQPC